MASFGDCPLVQGQLIQMDAASGHIQNIFKVVPDGCTGGSVWGSPTVDTKNNTIYFATGNAGSCSAAEPYAAAMIEVNATNLSFLHYWQVPSSEQIVDSDFGTTPTLFSATINGSVHYLVGAQNKNGKYYTFDRANINAGPIWKATIAVGGPCPQCGAGDISPSSWDGKKIYVGSSATTIKGTQCKGSIQALNPASGAFIWQRCLMNGAVLGAITEVPGVLAVGQGSNLTVLSASSGKTLFHYQDTTSGSVFYGAASISNGVLYIGNADGHLYAFGSN